LADLQRTVYPDKWSPVSRRSSAGQRKFACQRPTFYHCATHACIMLIIAVYLFIRLSLKRVLVGHWLPGSAVSGRAARHSASAAVAYRVVRSGRASSFCNCLIFALLLRVMTADFFCKKPCGCGSSVVGIADCLQNEILIFCTTLPPSYESLMLRILMRCDVWCTAGAVSRGMPCRGACEMMGVSVAPRVPLKSDAICE